MVNDPFIDIKELDFELKSIQQVGEVLDIHFPLLSQKVAYIFDKIETCKTFEEADSYFEILDKIQSSLAYLLYKYDIGLPDRLLRFTRDLDNLEPIYRKYYFEKIRLKEYSF
jgi:hypothetical protein